MDPLLTIITFCRGKNVITTHLEKFADNELPADFFHLKDHAYTHAHSTDTRLKQTSPSFFKLIEFFVVNRQSAKDTEFVFKGKRKLLKSKEPKRALEAKI